MIRGASIHDGSGEPPLVGDVAIQGERIVAVGKFVGKAKRELDGVGLIVAPGFIDLHSHSDRPILAEATRTNENFLRQGVTLVVTGNCGSGHVDVAEYFGKLAQQGCGTHVMHLVPHGSVRERVLGDIDRAPTADELAKMSKLVEQGMQDGACGMATGLIYVPGSFAELDELATLAAVVARHQGIYASHIRNEGARLIESLDEALEIGQRSGAAVHISHFKASGRANWPLAADALERLRRAREGGQRVTADQYPYTASSTSLAAVVIPDSYRVGQRFEESLADAEKKEALRQAVQAKLEQHDGGAAIMIASFKPDRSWQGRTLDKIAEAQKIAIVDLVLDIQHRGGAQIVNFGMGEEAVRLMMREPFVATASDGGARSLDDPDQPHPRSFGCFPRKIGRYAIEGQVLPLEQAIRSASGLPADILGLTHRGYLRAGYQADLVVFDPGTFRDVATYTEPLRHSEGVRHLFIEGRPVIVDGKYDGTLAGRPLRLADEQAPR